MSDKPINLFKIKNSSVERIPLSKKSQKQYIQEKNLIKIEGIDEKYSLFAKLSKASILIGKEILDIEIYNKK